MDATKLQLILLARIAGEAAPVQYVGDQLTEPVDPKSLVYRKVEPLKDGTRRVFEKYADGTTKTEIVG